MVDFESDADRTQTCNLLIRSQMLYSIKLRRLSLIASANVGQISELCKYFVEKIYKFSLVFCLYLAPSRLSADYILTPVCPPNRLRETPGALSRFSRSVETVGLRMFRLRMFRLRMYSLRMFRPRMFVPPPCVQSPAFSFPSSAYSLPLLRYLISRSGCFFRNCSQLCVPPFEAAFLPPPSPLTRSSPRTAFSGLEVA